MAIRILENVQPGDVAAVKQMFIDQGATDVSVQDEGDGEFKVVAFFPDVERHSDLIARTAIVPPGDLA